MNTPQTHYDGELGSLKDRGLRQDPPPGHSAPVASERLIGWMLMQITQSHITKSTLNDQESKDFDYNENALKGKFGYERQMEAVDLLLEALFEKAKRRSSQALEQAIEHFIHLKSALKKSYEQALAAQRAREDKECERKENEGKVAREAAEGRQELSRLGEAAADAKAEYDRLSEEFRRAPSVDLFAARGTAEQAWQNAKDAFEVRTADLRGLLATADTNAELAELEALEAEYNGFSIEEFESRIAAAVKTAGEIVRAELKTAIGKAHEREKLEPRLRYLREKHHRGTLAHETAQYFVLKRFIRPRMIRPDEFTLVREHNGLITLRMVLDGHILPFKERGH